MTSVLIRRMRGRLESQRTGVWDLHEHWERCLYKLKHARSHQKWKGMDRILSQKLQSKQSYWHLDFRSLAPITSGISFPVLLSHQMHGALLHYLRGETVTALKSIEYSQSPWTMIRHTREGQRRAHVSCVLMMEEASREDTFSSLPKVTPLMTSTCAKNTAWPLTPRGLLPCYQRAHRESISLRCH